MAILKEIVDGKEVFKITASNRSKIHKSIRIQRTKYFDGTLVKAEQVERKLRQEVSLEIQLKENKGIIWKELVSSWKETLMSNDHYFSDLQDFTKDDYICAVEKYTTSWSSRDVKSISTNDIYACINSARKFNITITRTKKIRTAISNVFEWAIRNGKILGVYSNPAKAISLKNDVEKEPEILTRDELKSFLKQAKELDQKWYPVWYLAASSGMRSGELFDLRWSDVNFNTGTEQISVNKSFCSKTKRTKSTKSGYIRFVPINDELKDFLLDLKLKTGDTGYVLPRIPAWAKGEQARVLRKFLYSVGIKQVKFHALRACFATHLLSSGTSIAMVQKICGWEDLKTLQIYVRLAGVETKGATDGFSVMA